MASCTVDPGSITGGTILTSPTYASGTKAVYQCNSGYVMSGDSFVTCTAGVWGTPLPTCALQTSSTLTNTDNNTFTSEFPTWLVYVMATIMGVFGLLILTCILVCCLQLWGCYRGGGLFGESRACRCCRCCYQDREVRYEVKPKHCTLFPRRYEYDENGRRFHYDDLGRRCYYEHRNKTVTTVSAVSPETESHLTETRDTRDDKHLVKDGGPSHAPHASQTNTSRYWTRDRGPQQKTPQPARTTFMNTVNEVVAENKKNKAKEPVTWMPHANPVRNFNTSTK